jgi:membrane fusion protein (multidrug efflux system)
VLAVPRAAVLSDQKGSYVFVVGNDDTAEQRRIQLGQSTQTLAGVISGLQKGERVVVEGLQRLRAGAKVAPGEASAQMQALMNENETGAAGSGSASDAPQKSAEPVAGGSGTSGNAADPTRKDKNPTRPHNGGR